MEKFKGTPGPWINVGGWVDAEKRSGELSGIICSISAVATRNPEAVNDANANLIAAAPELLEALKELISGYEDREQSGMFDMLVHGDLIEKANVAINKALGE